MEQTSGATSTPTRGLNAVGVHHLTFRVQDPQASRKWYENILGLQFMELPAPPEATSTWRSGSQPVYQAAAVGSTYLVWVPAFEGTDSNWRFDERHIGWDHVAFGVQDRAELDALVERLKAAGVATQGVEHDPVLDKDYVCFRDPDNFQVEAYML